MNLIKRKGYLATTAEKIAIYSTEQKNCLTAAAVWKDVANDPREPFNVRNMARIEEASLRKRADIIQLACDYTSLWPEESFEFCLEQAENKFQLRKPPVQLFSDPPPLTHFDKLAREISRGWKWPVENVRSYLREIGVEEK
jgi:hypothetical protein